MKPDPTTQAAELRAEHELKCWPQYFRAISDGRKPFEIRLNDRDFHEGDTLFLREWDEAGGGYTGETLRRRVTYILHGPAWGLCPSYCIMGLALTTGGDLAGAVTGRDLFNLFQREIARASAMPLKLVFEDCGPEGQAVYDRVAAALATPVPSAAGEEPTETEIARASYAWRNSKDRETDSADAIYFLNNWRSLPGLGAYVGAEVVKVAPTSPARPEATPAAGGETLRPSAECMAEVERLSQGMATGADIGRLLVGTSFEACLPDPESPLSKILAWYRALPKRARESMSLANLHTLAKQFVAPSPSPDAVKEAREAFMDLIKLWWAYQDSDLSHSDAHNCLCRYPAWDRAAQAIALLNGEGA